MSARRVIGRLAGAVAARPWHAGLGALVAGLAAGPTSRTAVVVVAGALVLLGALVRPRRLALLAAATLLAGGLVASARLEQLDRTALGARPGGAIQAHAVLDEPVRSRAHGGWSATATVTAGRGRGERIVLRAGRWVRPPRGGTGDVIALRGRLTPLAAYESYARVRGAHAAVVVEHATATGERRGGVAGAFDSVRRRAEAGVTAELPRTQAALARGMVLGEDDALGQAERDEFRASGLSHVLAASGQNVTLLALLATAGLAALGVGRQGRLLGSLGLIAVYVPLAGAGPSIQRAGIMGAAGLVAGLAGRPASRAYALLLAAAATLLVNPRATADVGWQLSFAAVIGIAILAGRWRTALTRRRVPPAAAEVLAVTLAATAATAPLLAFHFERLSLVSIPANLVAAPAVAPVVWLGTIAAALGQLGSPGLALAGLVNGVAAVPLGAVGWVAHVAAQAPHASVALALGGPLALAIAYGALAGVVGSRRVRTVAVGAAVAAALLVATGHRRPYAPGPELTLSFLDVGQGDATLIQRAGHAVLVDTGPPDGPILSRLHAAGVRRLDVLVLTHAQADHEGAAPAILRAMPVGLVLDGGAGVVRSPERAAIEGAERNRGVRRERPDAGQVITVGPVRMEVLWPHRAGPVATTTTTADAAASGDPNDRAVVALVREGRFSALLTADAESPVTLPLGLGRVDVLKVAHHGSADPGLPQLLAKLQPGLAAIEVGAHNPYGHPSPPTLRALGAVPRVVRTDRDGTVRVTVRGRAMTVTTHT